MKYAFYLIPNALRSCWTVLDRPHEDVLRHNYLVSNGVTTCSGN